MAAYVWNPSKEPMRDSNVYQQGDTGIVNFASLRSPSEVAIEIQKHFQHTLPCYKSARCDQRCLQQEYTEGKQTLLVQNAADCL